MLPNGAGAMQRQLASFHSRASAATLYSFPWHARADSLQKLANTYIKFGFSPRAINEDMQKFVTDA